MESKVRVSDSFVAEVMVVSSGDWPTSISAVIFGGSFSGVIADWRVRRLLCSPSRKKQLLYFLKVKFFKNYESQLI